ncbi:unnamed protein product [Lactuca virosa]|uniref:Uncharacterized protein n=1 Tax=Lactuca virosa TaxID=75947 RepID=A0AAU9MXI4_9ASTR|nr:unnamed protein product [Lactuca virosa]
MVLKGMFVTNGDVWKAIVCSLTIWFSGGVWKTASCSPAIWYSSGVCEKTGIPLTSSTICGVMLLKINVSCLVCTEVLCAITAAEETGPSTVDLHNSFVGAVVIIDPPS